jgi:hypothetical protein
MIEYDLCPECGSDLEAEDGIQECPNCWWDSEDEEG